MHGMILVEIHVGAVLEKVSELFVRTTASFHGDWKEDCQAPMLTTVAASPKFELGGCVGSGGVLSGSAIPLELCRPEMTPIVLECSTRLGYR